MKSEQEPEMLPERKLEIGSARREAARRMQREGLNIDITTATRTMTTAAAVIGAQAFRSGSDIYISPSNEKTLLGHELTHVVQQNSGRVSTTTQK